MLEFYQQLSIVATAADLQKIGMPYDFANYQGVTVSIR